MGNKRLTCDTHMHELLHIGREVHYIREKVLGYCVHACPQRLEQWSLELHAYDFRIAYRPGKDNQGADSCQCHL